MLSTGKGNRLKRNMFFMQVLGANGMLKGTATGEKVPHLTICIFNPQQLIDGERTYLKMAPLLGLEQQKQMFSSIEVLIILSKVKRVQAPSHVLSVA